jgi:hypothetical protein
MQNTKQRERRVLPDSSSPSSQWANFRLAHLAYLRLHHPLEEVVRYPNGGHRVTLNVREVLANGDLQRRIRSERGNMLLMLTTGIGRTIAQVVILHDER